VILGFLICLGILAFQFQARYPVSVRLAFVNDGGEERHVADAWQDWYVKYDSGEEDQFSSDYQSIALKWQLFGSKTFGAKTYTRVRIATKWLGGLSDWGTEVKVVTSANIYLGLPTGGIEVGRIETMPWLFSAGDPAGKLVYPEFWICGSQEMVNELKARFVGTESDLPVLKFFPLHQLAYELAYGKAFLNIESLLNEMEGRYSEFKLYVKAEQKWSAIQWPGIATSSRSYEIPFEVPFSTKASVTYTPTPTVTVGWTTQSGTPGIIVSYSYTFTVSATSYTLRTTTVIVTATTTTVATSDFIPVPTPDVWKWLREWFVGVVKANPWILLVLLVFAGLIGLIIILLVVKALRWAAGGPRKKQ